MIEKRRDNEVGGGGFEEGLRDEADDTGRRLAGVEVPLFEGRRAVDNGVGFIVGGAQKDPAFVGPCAAKDSKVFSQKARLINKRRSEV
jgi:hypothetical protein